MSKPATSSIPMGTAAFRLNAADIASLADRPATSHGMVSAPGSWNIRRPRRWIADHRFLFVSILAHLILGVVATVWIVQTTVTKRKLTFVAAAPPKRTLPQVKEYKVQMARQQKVSVPPGPRRVITTGLSKVALPDLPPMPSLMNALAPVQISGMDAPGADFGSLPFGGASGSFLPDGDRQMTSFGFRQHQNGTLVGTFYDLKQTYSGEGTPIASDNVGEQWYYQTLRHFVQHGWNPAELNSYFRARTELYASQIYIPIGESEEAAKAFNVEKEVSGDRWLVLYRGRIIPPRDGTFRFVGRGDNVLVVRLDGRNVFDGSCKDILDPSAVTEQTLGPCSAEGWQLAAGQWFTVQRGVSISMQVIIGDTGGAFSDFLLIEEKGATYEKRHDAPGYTAWPLFQLVKLPVPEPGFNEHWQGLNPETAKDPVVFGGEDKSSLSSVLHPDR